MAGARGAATRMPVMPSMTDLLKIYGVSAKKELGQNFLLDLNITDKIVKGAGSLEGVTCIDIGAGPGSLTRSLLNAGAKKVYAVETDVRFLPSLEQLASATGGRMEVIHANILKCDVQKMLEGTGRSTWDSPKPSVKVIANLPFNISTRLLINLLRDMHHRRGFFHYGRTELNLMFQQEVGDRIVSRPGAMDRSRLSMMCQLYATCGHVFSLSPRVFTPEPKVRASVIKFTPRDFGVGPMDWEFESAELVARALFSTRQKCLRNNMKALVDSHNEDTAAFLASANLDPSVDPDSTRSFHVGEADFLNLVKAFEKWKEARPEKNMAEWGGRGPKKARRLRIERERQAKAASSQLQADSDEAAAADSS